MKLFDAVVSLFGARRWLTALLLATSGLVAIALFPPSRSHVTSAPLASPIPIPSPSDPASDARLEAYQTTFDDASKIADVAPRCDRIASAFHDLTPDDIRKGRDIRTPAYSKNRLAALSQGETCQKAISTSNQHFSEVSRAVVAAKANLTPQTLSAAADALKFLDRFDQERPRFATDEALADARRFAAQKTDSDGKIAAVTNAAKAFESEQSAALALRLSTAASQLTDLDHTSMAGSHQQPVLDSANRATGLIAQGRLRLSSLKRLLEAAQAAPTPDNQQKLIDAVSGITTFDDGLADITDQRKMLNQAKATAQAAAWLMLQQRLDELSKSRKSADYERVTAIYKLLKDLPPEALTSEQKRLLEKAESAAAALATSDGHLQDLMNAYTQWQKLYLSAGDVVTSTVREITQSQLDQTRLVTPEQKAAWDALKKADAIVRGPEIGFSAATSGHMPIFSEVTRDDQVDSRATTSMVNRLSGNGFAVTSDKNEAGLVLTITVLSVSQPDRVPDEFQLVYQSTAKVRYTLAWAADNTRVLVSNIAEKVGKGPDSGGQAQAAALIKDLDEVLEKLIVLRSSP